MTEAEEDKLLALKDFMLKSNKAKANMGDQSHLGEAVQSGVIDLATLGIMGRQVDLVKPKQEAEDKRGRDATDTWWWKYTPVIAEGYTNPKAAFTQTPQFWSFSQLLKKKKNTCV